ncbi:MAG: hypothetical protein V2J62_05630, partial [candidate division KSB1 bacterium]|nr:hypothetical protein [candidate division KSB1 bacterium]
MPKTLERILLIVTDLLMLSLSFIVWCEFRAHFGFYINKNIMLMLIIFLYWFFIFFFFGLYRSWYAQSRFDEIIAVIKSVTIGALLAFILTMDIESDIRTTPSLSRLIFVAYWFLVIFFVSTGRLVLRTVQRKLLEMGIGRRTALIIGWNDKARQLYDTIVEHRALGYDVIGFLSLGNEGAGENHSDCKVIGSVKNLRRIVNNFKVEEILIAIKARSHKKVIDVISMCDDLPVTLKILPDIYDIVMGYGRTEQLYGVPLIEIMPQMMPAWEKRVKRFIDVIVSLTVLILFLPFWILLAILIKIDSRG